MLERAGEAVEQECRRKYMYGTVPAITTYLLPKLVPVLGRWFVTEAVRTR